MNQVFKTEIHANWSMVGTENDFLPVLWKGLETERGSWPLVPALRTVLKLLWTKARVRLFWGRKLKQAVSVFSLILHHCSGAPHVPGQYY